MATAIVAGPARDGAIARRLGVKFFPIAGSLMAQVPGDVLEIEKD